jgi:nucleoside-diphosphate-sugar epimerase
VFHLAARVHADDEDDPAFLHDNVDKTLALARAAARGGARRFVFLSSVKVNGEESLARPFTRATRRSLAMRMRDPRRAPRRCLRAWRAWPPSSCARLSSTARA